MQKQVLIYFFCCIFSGILLHAQNPELSTWYSAKGKVAQHNTIVKAALEADVILFGELHNNSVCHWHQIKIFKSLITQAGSRLKAGAEMFERHQQEALDSFLQGKIKSEAFLKEHAFWPNYKTDYHRITELAAEHKIPYYATNAPRKYARLVSKSGQESLLDLSEDEKRLLCPLPFPVDTNLNCYKNLLSMGHGNDFNGYYFASAQALKDATMAHIILQNLNPGEIFYHLNGAYHSDYFESISWYLRQARPGIKILTITTLESEGLKKPSGEDIGKADFYLVTDPDVVKSY